ncbi:Adenosine monophosphate-protein transferase SoFic [Caloramator mitchellensis]|uniref:Adenosine monophosphate-protein transferase SoFic n=1 Tax=Caloramator mitchellensis TaxID=908809 RepID=A0A0R3JSR0_CALMK|nr:Fic family protein [Caloramator mitchellensis]KRQ86507.1 Adenosine monophosphate-protein transferase SoFic [Caloramator mitchellensis]
MKPFIPHKLPIDELIEVKYFMKELLNSVEKITEYQTMLKNTKMNPDLLLAPITIKEALQSTKIEGTQTTLDEVLESEADDRIKSKDVREVLNYYEALNKGRELLNTLPISTRLFKELHKTLLSGDVRGKDRSPGEFRKIQNFIGPEGCSIERATFVPPEPQLVDEYMSNLENYINTDDDMHELIKIAIIHAQFETIHPFLDGNGRIGRILIPLYLYYKGKIYQPNFFISDTLEKDKHKYYKLLNETRTKNNWNEWIKFFLKAAAEQAEKNIKLIKDVESLYEKQVELATNTVRSTNIIKVVDEIFNRPIFTVKSIKKNTGLSDSTVRHYLSKLEDINMIYADNSLRDKRYYFYDLLDIIR